MSRRASITFLYVLVLLLLLSAPSCTVSEVSVPQPTVDPALVDSSWFTGEPCLAPCWHGLEPGKTKKEEALRVTRQLSFLQADKVDTGTIWGNAQTFAFACKGRSDRPCVYMVFQEDTLASITTYLPAQVPLAEIVAKVGTPDGFTIRPLNPEGKGCTISLFWKDRRTQVDSSDDWQKQSIFRDDLCQTLQKADRKVPANLPVHAIDILDEKLLKLRTEDGLVPWNGFIPDK